LKNENSVFVEHIEDEFHRFKYRDLAATHGSVFQLLNYSTLMTTIKMPAIYHRSLQ